MKHKILYKLSGSIACFKSCEVISALVKAGHTVQVAASEAALRFVGEATLEGLTGRPVFSDAFMRSQVMDHVRWTRWADLTILCPATANTLNGFAAGVSTDVLGTLFLAHDFKKPYLVVPAMNQSMYLHPTTQASLKKLADYGVKILPTDEGALACGEWGPGRLIAPEKIYSAVQGNLEGARRESPRDLGRDAGAY